MTGTLYCRGSQSLHSKVRIGIIINVKRSEIIVITKLVFRNMLITLYNNSIDWIPSRSGSGPESGLWEALLYCKKHCPSDETLNRGPDSLWSLKIPGCPSKKIRGVTPASWPTGLWPSWPPNHPHTLISFITVSSPPVNWCVVGVLVSHHPGGCCTLVVDEEIPPLLCKVLWVSRKVLYKCNKLL